MGIVKTKFCRRLSPSPGKTLSPIFKCFSLFITTILSTKPPYRLLTGSYWQLQKQPRSNRGVNATALSFSFIVHINRNTRAATSFHGSPSLSMSQFRSAFVGFIFYKIIKYQEQRGVSCFGPPILRIRIRHLFVKELH